MERIFPSWLEFDALRTVVVYLNYCTSICDRLRQGTMCPKAGLFSSSPCPPIFKYVKGN
ncbi:hypothetical protein SLEP1_g10079 [Rubroshorea leprosula]|uniref:Uncharacterized protein n=1 Tax=Rubroshorea leprosula TaxID=152421 RepID=A0AAV5IG84_9ROSI|nr:hypothetical protein SLEP1_g10079 [Rubroshorea leprosula]